MFLRRLLPLFFVLLFVIGCGPRTGDVNGTVTYKGKLVRIGNVMLLPDKGAHAYAELKDDGTFTASKIPVGSYRVTVTSPDPSRPVMVKGESVAKPKGPPDPRWFALPSNASDPEKSGLRFEVTRGVNNWEVKVN
jgi:hypothetical protein